MAQIDVFSWPLATGRISANREMVQRTMSVGNPERSFDPLRILHSHPNRFARCQGEARTARLQRHDFRHRSWQRH